MWNLPFSSNFLQKSRFGRCANHYFSNTWLPECVAILTSLAATAVIVAVLAANDQRDITEWHFPGDITISALISIFSTIAKSLLAIAVSVGLGQFKWLWFTGKARPIADFDTIDQASRGPWGSLQVLWMANVRRVPALLASEMALSVMSILV